MAVFVQGAQRRHREIRRAHEDQTKRHLRVVPMIARWF
jgi:hypothetical protein